MTLVVRPDLSQRTALSKSAIASADWCQTAAWFDIHDRRPMFLTEKLVFGSCLDAAVEQLIKAARADVPLSEAKPLVAAEEIIERDGVDVDLTEIALACDRFGRDVIPNFPWEMAGLQVTLHEDVPGIGEVQGHPDVRLEDGSIFDVKSSSKRKGDNDAATSVELGLYALLSEQERGYPCPRVGYWTWVRSSKPGWQLLESPVTDEMRRRTRAVASAYVRAKAADELLNRNVPKPVNFTFTGGPKYPGKCADCQYAPQFDGPCQIAFKGVSDVA